MVLAYHIIISAYGFWLPNDPRGSWSDFVWAWELSRFGKSTKTPSRESQARVEHDVALRLAGKDALLRPPVRFTPEQEAAIADGFADAAKSGRYEITACAILPEHVHAVVKRHPDRDIEMIGSHLKARASTFLAERNLHPFQDDIGRRGKRPSPWSESFWQVYLSSSPHIKTAVEYVEKNPIKEGREAQPWAFVSKPSFAD